FYDPIRTAALNLPGTIEGGAFRKQNGEHIYVLWAKALTDRSEAAVSNYTFPTALNLPPLRRYEWNNSVVPNNNVIQPSNISLTGAPIFLTPASTVVLPVDMLLFTGKRLSVSQARLTWQTAQEDAKTEYVIERSLDGTSFARIGSLPGKAAQAGASYSFVDQRATGQVYYRLSWKTVHGEKHYSKVITIAGNIPAAFRVYPNPTSDFIFIDANFSEDTKLALVDNSGRVLGTYPPTTKRIDIRKYPAGNYVLQATGVVTKQQSNFVITK
ncbi:MAG: T9SS type A sorting domain-containing protein, partial [Pedobacter sp.]